ncbi:MAG: PAS domain-containing sensor histidine kinase [Gammaproteobacteria bacterium]|nr:MAG: PAS domain-containing sensor histidine kinase [Gammaproteobacteria bacterium]
MKQVTAKPVLVSEIVEDETSTQYSNLYSFQSSQTLSPEDDLESKDATIENPSLGLTPLSLSAAESIAPKSAHPPAIQNDNFTDNNYANNSSPSNSSPNNKSLANKSPALKEDLSHSFELFIKTSNELAQAYHSIQGQLEDMQIELRQTQQQRLEELERKEVLSARLENLLNVLPCGVIVLDGAGLIQTINPYGREIFQEIELGERWIDVINREFSPQADDGHEISLKNGKRVSIETRSLNQEPGQIISLSDLTENRRLQRDLARHQRLSEMGKMLASLAHQIRTPLSAAILYGSQLENKSLDTVSRGKTVAKLQNRLGCINQQIKDLLIFVRGGVELDEMISLEVLLHSLQRESEVLLNGSHSTLELQGDFDDCWLLVNRSALVGALCNLIENSVHAVISHGHIVIKRVIDPQADQALLLLHVSDNGPGISDHDKSKIMEPFFTTKSTGTGLGLSVVRAIVRAHGGVFSLNPQVRTGAGFIIQLPLRQIEFNQQ